MSTDATETPIPTEGEDQSQSIQAPAEATSAQATEAPDYFGDNFDPSTLDEALQPAYKQMQGAWTRKTQELAEQRKQAENATAFFTDLHSEDNRANALNWLAEQLGGPEQLVAALGYELDEQPPEAPELDETIQQYLDQRLTPLEQQAQQRQMEEYAAQLDERFQKESAEIEKSLGIELPQEAWRSIVDHTMAVAAASGNEPDLQAAFDAYNSFAEARIKGWTASKQGGATTPGGQAATEVPDLDNPQERREHMARMLAARDAP